MQVSRFSLNLSTECLKNMYLNLRDIKYISVEAIKLKSAL
jgi:hypothetical protein